MSDQLTQGGTQRSELGALLAGTVQAVVDAQDLLDEHARKRALEYEAAEPGSLALPPLWYAFDSVGIDIDLSSEVVRTAAQPGGVPRTQLVCRTLNPVTAGVYGYSASTGTRVRLTVAPQRVAPTTAQAVRTTAQAVRTTAQAVRTGSPPVAEAQEDPT